MLGEETALIPFKPLGPLGGREAAGSTLLDTGVFLGVA